MSNVDPNKIEWIKKAADIDRDQYVLLNDLVYLLGTTENLALNAMSGKFPNALALLFQQLDEICKWNQDNKQMLSSTVNLEPKEDKNESK